MQFLIETTCLSVSGGIVGVMGGIGGAISWDHFSMAVIRPMSRFRVLFSFGISAGVGVIFGLYPAIVAAHKDPIEALRHD